MATQVHCELVLWLHDMTMENKLGRNILIKPVQPHKSIHSLNNYVFELTHLSLFFISSLLGFLYQ